MSFLDWDPDLPPHLPLPNDPWDDWSITPAAPSDDTVRRAVQAVMNQRSDWGPSRIKADLHHRQRLEVSIAVIHGVKAGL